MSITIHFPSMIIGAILMIPVIAIAFLIWGIRIKMGEKKK